MERTEYDRMSAVEDTMWWYAGAHANVMTAVARHLRVPGKAILDAGSGTGGFLRRLVREYPHRLVVGLEYDHSACVLASSKSGASVARGSVDSLPFPDRTFGAIVSLDVLCHRNVREGPALRELARCLDTGGVLVLNLPAFEWLTSDHDRLVHNARRYTSRRIRALLTEAGLRIQRITYWNTLLFPLMVARRKLGSDSQESDVTAYPPLVDRGFRALLALESRMLAVGINLPVGGSVLSVAVKP